MLFRQTLLLIWIGLGAINSEVLRLPDCGKYHGQFDVWYKDKSLNGYLISRFVGISWKGCNEKCRLYGRCKSMNFIDESRNSVGICEINSKDANGSTSLLVDRANSYYVETPIFGIDQRKVRIFSKDQSRIRKIHPGILNCTWALHNFISWPVGTSGISNA